VELGGAIELHAAFREESRTSLPQGVPRAGNPGKHSAFSWFSPKENHTSRSLPGHSNCETALVLLMEDGVVDVRPDFLESERAPING
jgi:hypothetical protein